MNKAFNCMAISTDTDTDNNESGVTTDIHICKTEEIAVSRIKKQATRNNPSMDIIYAEARELDMNRLMNDWIDGKKNGDNYYKNSLRKVEDNTSIIN